MGAGEIYSSTVEFLRRRKRGYQLTFGNNQIVTSLRRAYTKAFGNMAGQAVLIDLARFCRAAETTFHPSQDERTQAMLEGRRQVWLRIEQHLRLQPTELYALYAGQNFSPRTQGDDDG